ncbi:hypothetical protein NQ318_002487 [Aromia moschata]|uniref:Uncharacterized protein n=1 Tax=Aromia moschata TaxID=1265417 RepID=A0AAV8YA11_9CUCU|nr:hypothetical protein NQ318_002487 [Aromia moschata]
MYHEPLLVMKKYFSGMPVSLLNLRCAISFFAKEIRCCLSGTENYLISMEINIVYIEKRTATNILQL